MMSPEIQKFIQNNPSVKYTKIFVEEDKDLYNFYNKKYPMPVCPAFLGLVDGKVQDGHVGYATEMVLSSLVS